MNCGRQGCERCLKTFGQVYVPPKGWRPQQVCSDACFDAWAFGHVSQGKDLIASGGQWTFLGVTLTTEYAGRVRKMADDHHRQLGLGHAKNMLDAARYEDAARTYELMGMYREAGEARRIGRRQVTTQVSVNVNDLLEQLRRMGLTASYTCPVCHSPSSISGDSPPDALAKCRYCGAVIHPTDLVEALTKVIGYR